MMIFLSRIVAMIPAALTLTIIALGAVCRPATAATATDLRELAKHCGNGVAAACVDLGNAFHDANNYYESSRLFQKACAAGEALGCNNLGVNYEKGYGVARNYVEAGRLYKNACDGGRGVALACRNLGYLYKNGLLRSNDPFVGSGYWASIYFSFACDGGNAEGCNEYGVYLANGGNWQEVQRSALYFKKACNGNVELGCHNLRWVCSLWTYPPSGCPRW